jgi:hypothetical protein
MKEPIVIVANWAHGLSNRPWESPKGNVLAVAIPLMVSVFKCVSSKLLFEEFPELKLRLRGGHLWSEGYAVRTAGSVPMGKIEEYINRV